MRLLNDVSKVVLFVFCLLCFVSSRSIFGFCSCQGGTSGKEKFIVFSFENFNSLKSSRILRQKGLVKFFRDSMFFTVVGSGLKTQSCAGFSGVELILTAYCKDSFFLLRWRDGSLA